MTLPLVFYVFVYRVRSPVIRVWSRSCWYALIFGWLNENEKDVVKKSHLQYSDLLYDTALVISLSHNSISVTSDIT